MASFRSWNESAERIFSYTAEEMVGKILITILFPPDRLNEEPKILERIHRGERVEHFETVRVRKDGTPVHVSLTISPIRDQNGKVVGVSKVARDITATAEFRRPLQGDHRLFRRRDNQQVSQRDRQKLESIRRAHFRLHGKGNGQQFKSQFFSPPDRLDEKT